MINRIATTGHGVKKMLGDRLFLFALTIALSLSVLNLSSMGLAQNPPQAEASSVERGPTVEHTPSQLPTVTFHNGQLTITAYNASLRDILEMVRAQTGAAIDIPPEANERVFINVGPGPTRRVLDSLLAGSNFNYVLLGSETNPQALTKVVLALKPTGNTDNGTVAETAPLGHRRVEPQVARRQEASSDDAEQPTAPIQQASDSAPAEPSAASAQKQENVEKTEGSDRIEAAADISTQAPVEYPRTPNIRTAQEVLQDLYARRQAIQQQQQHPSSPQ